MDTPPLLRVVHDSHWPSELVCSVRVGWCKKFKIYHQRRVDGQKKFDLFKIEFGYFNETLDGDEMAPAADMIERSFRQGVPGIHLRSGTSTAGSHWRGLEIPAWAAEPLVAAMRRLVSVEPSRAEEAATQTPEYARGFADGVKYARGEGKPF